MEQNYTPRRSSSSAQRYRSSPQRGDYPQRRRPQRGRKRNPWPLILVAVILALAIVAVVLWMIFAGNSKDPASASSGAPSSQISSQFSETSQLEGTGSNNLISDPASGSPVSSTPNNTSAVSVAPAEDPTGVVEKIDTMVKIGDTGYEYYNFNTDAANQYITTVSDVGTQLSGTATVYDIIIPTSMDIMLSEEYIQKNIGNTSDQRKAIEEYIYPSINGMNPAVKTVSIFDTLKNHNGEYIYFRTDHHWTQLGAYYAYVEFCNAKGVEAVPLSQFEKKEYPGFLGSFYQNSPNSDMQNNPDTVEAYLPQANTSMYVMQSNGEALENWPLINVGTDENYSAGNKYLIFAAGDQPYEEITNNNITDGSSCVVVKESFGNCFVPFLVNHYQTVYVIDYRYYENNIADLVREKGSQDLILVNNISMTRNESLVQSLDNSF